MSLPFGDTIRRAGRRLPMTRSGSVLLAILLSAASLLYAQVDKIVIPAGTPEDQALNAINNEQDAQKRLAMYQEFQEKFASNPVAVAYANWQLSQYYQTAVICRKRPSMATRRRLALLTILTSWSRR